MFLDYIHGGEDKLRTLQRSNVVIDFYFKYYSRTKRIIKRFLIILQNNHAIWTVDNVQLQYPTIAFSGMGGGGGLISAHSFFIQNGLFCKT